MKKYTRILALLLVVIMAIGMFAACGDVEPEETTTEATTTEATTTEATTTEATTTEATTTEATTTEATTTEAPGYGGYEFTINDGKFFPAYDEAGSPVSAADAELVDKLAELEAQLDIKIVHQPIETESMIETISTAAMAGQMLTDILYVHQEAFIPAAKSDYLYAVDGEEVTGLGLDYTDSSRWYQPTVQEVFVFDHFWGLDVASKYVDVRTGYFVNFNHDIVLSAGYDDLYQMVREKTWNWEVYMDVATKVTKDTDQDGTFDIYGTGATAWGCEAVSNGVNYIQPDETGKWVVGVDSEAGRQALQFLYDMNYGSATRLDEGSGTCRQAFADGTIAFNWSNMGHIGSPDQTIRQSNHEYGIVPMPLGPNATEYVSAHDDLNLIVIQKTNKDLARTVDVLNNWALVVNDTESYLEILDDGRCYTDADKEMMVDYIIPNFCLVMMEITDEIYDPIDAGIISGVSYYQMTPAQAIETYGSVIQAALDSFFNS